MKKYYVVDRSMLPEVLDKVVEAQRLIQSGAIHQISEAVKQVGISRATYYKYKDAVFLPTQEITARKAIISMMLEHKKGMLSQVLNYMSDAQTNILTINQNIPINNIASVTISFDMGEMTMDIDELIKGLDTLDGVGQLRLIAIE